MVPTLEHTEHPALATSRRQGFQKSPNGTGVHMHTHVRSPEQGRGDWPYSGRGRRGSISCAGLAWEGHVRSSHQTAQGPAGSLLHCFLSQLTVGTDVSVASLRTQSVQDTRLGRERTRGAALA